MRWDAPQRSGADGKGGAGGRAAPFFPRKLRRSRKREGRGDWDRERGTAPLDQIAHFCPRNHKVFTAETRANARPPDHAGEPTRVADPPIK